MPRLKKNKKLAWEKPGKTLSWNVKKNWLADQDNAHLYHTTQWRKLRHSKLLDNPVCQMEGCTQPSYYCDHIEPYKKGMDFYDESNLQMLCKSCNYKKTAAQKTTKFTK